MAWWIYPVCVQVIESMHILLLGVECWMLIVDSGNPDSKSPVHSMLLLQLVLTHLPLWLWRLKLWVQENTCWIFDEVFVTRDVWYQIPNYGDIFCHWYNFNCKVKVIKMFAIKHGTEAVTMMIMANIIIIIMFQYHDNDIGFWES